jgi:hypothetical protein
MANSSNSDAASTDGLAHSAPSGSLANAEHPYHRLYVQAYQGLEGKNLDSAAPGVTRPDIASELTQAGVNADFNRNGQLDVLAGKHEGTLFSVQGHLRGLVFLPEVEPNSAPKIGDQLQKEHTMQNALNTEMAEEKTKGRSQA